MISLLLKVKMSLWTCHQTTKEHGRHFSMLSQFPSLPTLIAYSPTPLPICCRKQKWCWKFGVWIELHNLFVVHLPNFDANCCRKLLHACMFKVLRLCRNVLVYIRWATIKQCLFLKFIASILKRRLFSTDTLQCNLKPWAIKHCWRFMWIYFIGTVTFMPLHTCNL